MNHCPARSLLEVMFDVGIATGAEIDLTPDETWRRINTEGSSSKNGAYIVRRASRGAGVMVSLVNHSTGESANWWSEADLPPAYCRRAPSPSKPPVDYFGRTKALWDALDDTSGAHSPYLQSKQVPSFRIARYSPSQRVTLIPIQDTCGQLVAIQRIPDPPYSSDKRIHGRSGLYCQIHGNPSHLALVEGFATGGSVRLITGYTVAVTFSTSGMIRFAEELARSSKKLPEIAIFADNDVSTATRIGRNPGVDAAKKAAAIIDARIFIPPINGDWNDAHVRHGLDVVKTMFRNRRDAR